jgi:hypothetical protein
MIAKTQKGEKEKGSFSGGRNVRIVVKVQLMQKSKTLSQK